jgi:hypothetical protein
MSLFLRTSIARCLAVALADAPIREQFLERFMLWQGGEELGRRLRFYREGGEMPLVCVPVRVTQSAPMLMVV